MEPFLVVVDQVLLLLAHLLLVMTHNLIRVSRYYIGAPSVFLSGLK